MPRRPAATAVAATGLVRAGQVLCQPDAAITPLPVPRPAERLDDLKPAPRPRRAGETGERYCDGRKGVPIAEMKARVEYWRTGYDWRRCEVRLNRVPQYRTEIDGLGIYIRHVRSRETKRAADPHHEAGELGVEFSTTTHPDQPDGPWRRAQDAFDVVAPSLPGSAFSNAS